MNQLLAQELDAINARANRRNQFDSFEKDMLDTLARYPAETFIRDPEKSRLKVKRGTYYTYQDAIQVRDVLLASRGKLPFVTNRTQASSPQWWRQGLAFLRENLDRDLTYSVLSKGVSPYYEAGFFRLKARGHREPITGVKQTNVEFSDIIKWLDTAEPGATFFVNNLSQEDIDALANVAAYDGEKLTRL